VEDKQVAERRRDGRQAIAGTVTVRLPAQAVVGPGENVSADGVFFVADGSLQVEVTLPGESKARRGELVRVAAMGEGRVGIAIKFPVN
jgi:hypothetical protein